jgi:hypothetical protein
MMMERDAALQELLLKQQQQGCVVRSTAFAGHMAICDKL